MNCPFCTNIVTSQGSCSYCLDAKYPGVRRVKIYTRFRDIFLEKYAIALDTLENKTIIESISDGKFVLVVNTLLPITPQNAQSWCDKLLKLKAFS